MHIRATCTGPGCAGNVEYRLSEQGRFVGACDACGVHWDIWEGTVTRMDDEQLYARASGGPATR